MLKFVFDWLDLHPGSYWIIALAPSLLLVVRIMALIGREDREPVAPPPGAAWRDALVLFLFLLAWRWPFLFVAHEYNPDESQLAAGAMALAHDPVFWRAVDGGSSGPLNYYFLVPWQWLGLPLNYFTVRLTGLLLIWGALFSCQRTLAGAYGRTIAWLGILPAAAFFATVTHPELIHYSTEHLPLFLIAVAFGLLAGHAPPDRIRLWAACLVAGTLPWVKLQTAPIGLALIGWGWWQVLRDPGCPAQVRWKRAAGALLAAALPTLLLVALVAATGQTEAAVRRYVLQNFLYVGNGVPLGEAVGALWRNAGIDGRFPLFFGTACIGMFAAASYLVRHRIRPTGRPVAGLAITLAALVAIIAPHREFLHYVLLLPVPLTLCLGAVWGECWRHRAGSRARQWVAGAGLVAGLLPLLTRGDQPVPDIYGRFAYHWSHPRSSAATVLHALAGPNDTLGLWGWASHLFVESGLPQATRDTNTLWSIVPGAQQAYHRACFLDDLRRHSPALFVDAVGQGAFTFDFRALQAHETFPELADFIRQNYTLVIDLLDARIYARNGLPSLSGLSPARLRQLVALGRTSENFSMTPPSISLDRLQHKLIAHRRVIMLLPPTRVEWWLEEDVREVSLEFGYDPAAYEEGQSNGTEVILELVDPQSTRVVYRRFLDPAHQLADRGPQSTRITLPPLRPDTTLVLRTDPGPSGDNAWDWVYLATLQLHRHPRFLPQQFPGFNRVPDSASAGTATILEDGSQRLLQLHVPGSLSYIMRGDEHQLSLSYGFRPGAYSNGGQTEGAIYRLELLGPGRPKKLVFERHLQPVSREEDRGAQHLNITLPVLQRGDILTLKIEPGPSGSVAWGWTTISGFDLK